MCGKKKNLNYCSGCLQRQYCSPKCQKDAWPEHKALCKGYQFVGLEVTDPKEVVFKLNNYLGGLIDSNRLESALRVAIEVLALSKEPKMKSDTTLGAMGNVSAILRHMSRYQEAEIFAREMVAESEKLTPIRAIHATAIEKLCTGLIHQEKFEEAQGVAHEALERFRPLVPEGHDMITLMEAESVALSLLDRHEEALVLSQHCLKTRTEHPERFPNRGKVPSCSFFTLGALLMHAGRLDEAEGMLKKAQAMQESDGKEVHPDMVQTMSVLGDVYRLQGRNKEATAMMKGVKKLVPQVYPKDHPGYKMYMG
jgi:tetratricopeptide (TPR) repeat protein